MVLSQFARQVTFIIAAVACGWLGFCSLLIAQPPLAVPAPHEIVQGEMAEKAQELGSERDWTLVDRDSFRGKLLQWNDESGLIFLRDQFGRVSAFPLRQFDEEGRRAIDQLLGAHRDLMSRLRDREALPRPENMSLGKEPNLQHASPVEVTEDSVYWRLNRMYVRSPMDQFAASDVDELRTAMQARDALPLWHGRLPRYHFHGELIGQTKFGGNRKAYVFRGFHWAVHHFDDFKFLVAQDHLAPADCQRAETLLASKPRNGMFERSQAPRMWWPLGEPMEPPKRPLAFEGDMLKVRQPARAPAHQQQPGDARSIRWPETKVPVARLVGDAELLARQVLEEERLTAEKKDITDESLAKALQEFTERTLAERPFHFFSPLSRWTLRDLQPGYMFAGRVVAEQGPYWIFLDDKLTQTFAALKSEIPDIYLSYGQDAIQQVNRYLQEHPEMPPLDLDTKLRVVRLLPHSVIMCEPVAIKDERRLEVKASHAPDQTIAIDLQRLHFLDAQELKLILMGGATTPAEAGSMASSTDARKRLLAADQLRQLEHKERSWSLSPRASGTSNGMRFGFMGALQGRNQDDLVFRQGDIGFVVDPDLLDEKAQAEADELLDKLTELRKQAGTEPSPLPRPGLRMWGYLSAKSILGSQMHLTEEGALVFVDHVGKEVQIPASDVTLEFRGELALQAELAKSFRPTAPAVLSQEDSRRVAELKQQIRKAEAQQLAAQAAANVLDKWHLKDCLMVFPGRFIRFDGDDVLMKTENGELVRILKVAFTDESFERLEELAADPEYQKQIAALAQLDPAQVTLRVFRSSANSFLSPATPISFDPRSMSVKAPNGRIVSFNLSQIHRRDLSEMRSQMYLKANGLQRDEQIDERLRQPVDPKDVLQGPAALNATWRRRLDEMLQPRELVWSQRKVETLPGERVLALSPDGSHVILGPDQKTASSSNTQPANLKRELRVVEVGTGRARAVAASFTPSTPIFVTGDNRGLVLFEGGSLRLIDLQSGKPSFTIDDLKDPPLAACQSAEGNHLVVLLSDARILHVSLRDQKSEMVRLQDRGKFAETPSAWCSADGMRFVVTLEKHLQVFSVDEQTRQIQAEFPATTTVSRPLVALAKSLVVLADPEQTTAGFVGKLNGSRLTSLQFPTGLKPVWLSVEQTAGGGVLHVIGKPIDPLSQAAEYSYSTWIDFDGHMQYKTQSIDGLITAESVFAPSGRAVAFEQDDQWYVATQRKKLSTSPFQPLDDITRDLIEDSSLDQIDAAWAYLRSAPFQKLGDFPDQASETFFELMAANISMYGWQHGGDLEARADLLLDRWEKLAPRSLFVPTLKAMRQRDRAWQARGTGFADTVTEAGAKEFHDRMLTVAGLLKPLFQEEHPPTRAFRLAFDVSMSLGLPLDVTKRLNKSMMQTPVKYSTTAHAAVVLLLLPRWHGDPGDSEYYITTIADELGGDAGDCMYAQLFLYAAQYHPSDQPLSVHLKYDAERLLKGLKVYYQSPRSGQYLQKTLTIFAAEEYWDLYRKAMQLQTDARIFLDQVDGKLLAKRAAEQAKALGGD